ncbi:MAG: hypothetical protein M1833_004822 [Piccolia ochrophora]|nr:MAG: hypothetical protein M1833_004822 [Piccolia ochrophora]
MSNTPFNFPPPPPPPPVASPPAQSLSPHGRAYANQHRGVSGRPHGSRGRNGRSNRFHGAFGQRQRVPPRQYGIPGAATTNDQYTTNTQPEHSYMGTNYMHGRPTIPSAQYGGQVQRNGPSLDSGPMVNLRSQAHSHGQYSPSASQPWMQYAASGGPLQPSQALAANAPAHYDRAPNTSLRASIYNYAPNLNRKYGSSTTFGGSAKTTPISTAPPPVPSFLSASLPPKPPNVEDAALTSNGTRKRKYNFLGLTPRKEEHEDSEDSVDEEARYGGNTDQRLEFEYKGRTSTLISQSDIAAWIAQRKKNYPTRRRNEEKQNEEQRHWENARNGCKNANQHANSVKPKKPSKGARITDSRVRSDQSAETEAIQEKRRRLLTQLASQDEKLARLQEQGAGSATSLSGLAQGHGQEQERVDVGGSVTEDDVMVVAALLDRDEEQYAKIRGLVEQRRRESGNGAPVDPNGPIRDATDHERVHATHNDDEQDITSSSPSPSWTSSSDSDSEDETSTNVSSDEDDGPEEISVLKPGDAGVKDADSDTNVPMETLRTVTLEVGLRDLAGKGCTNGCMVEDEEEKEDLKVLYVIKQLAESGALERKP